LIAPREAWLLSVSALETEGFNAIPDAMARVLAAESGLRV
jgi:hypothetical protein